MGQGVRAVWKSVFLAMGLMAGIGQAAAPQAQPEPGPAAEKQVKPKPGRPKQGRRVPPERQPPVVTTQPSEECFAELTNPEQPTVRIRIIGSPGETVTVKPLAEAEEFDARGRCNCRWCARNCTAFSLQPLDLSKLASVTVTPGAEFELYSGEQGDGKSLVVRGTRKLDAREMPLPEARSARLKCPEKGAEEQPTPPRPR